MVVLEDNDPFRRVDPVVNQVNLYNEQPPPEIDEQLLAVLHANPDLMDVPEPVMPGEEDIDIDIGLPPIFDFNQLIPRPPMPGDGINFRDGFMKFAASRAAQITFTHYLNEDEPMARAYYRDCETHDMVMDHFTVLHDPQYADIRGIAHDEYGQLNCSGLGYYDYLSGERIVDSQIHLSSGTYYRRLTLDNNNIVICL